MKTWKVFAFLCFSTAAILVIFLTYVRFNPSTSLLFHAGFYKSFNDTDNGRCLKKYYEDVLLIIAYHYPFYSTIPLLLSHYKGAFPRIVVCGPKESTAARYQIIVAAMGPRGYYSYECLLNAMRLYPGYKGYLFVNDDMVVNWWNFAVLDKNKVWQGAPVSLDVTHEIGQRPVPDDWMWWRSVDGAENCENAYRDVTNLANDLSTSIDVGRLLKTHFYNGNNKTLCFRTWSDFVYIPGKFAQEFKQLTEIFRRNNVFLEIALPTIMSFLDEWRRFEKVYGVYLTEVYGFQDFSNIKYVWPKFAENASFLHPVKFFGEKGYRNRKLFKMRVISYGRQFLYC